MFVYALCIAGIMVFMCFCLFCFFYVSENLFNLTENFKVQIKNLTAKELNVQKIDIQIC